MTDKINIYVEMHWELRTKEYGKNKVTDMEYVDKFTGGYTIVQCKGYPGINGGMGTPDMMATFPTEQSLRDKLINEYSERYPDHLIKVHIKITKDDRNPTMDNYF